MAERHAQLWKFLQRTPSDHRGGGEADIDREIQVGDQARRAYHPIGAGWMQRMHEHRHVEALSLGEERLEEGIAGRLAIYTAANFDAKHAEIAQVPELLGGALRVLERDH